MNEPGLEKAMDTLQFLSQDSEARRLYEARQKYLHDEASMLDRAESVGKKTAESLWFNTKKLRHCYVHPIINRYITT